MPLVEDCNTDSMQTNGEISNSETVQLRARCPGQTLGTTVRNQEYSIQGLNRAIAVSAVMTMRHLSDVDVPTFPLPSFVLTATFTPPDSGRVVGDTVYVTASVEYVSVVTTTSGTEEVLTVVLCP